jgi:DHA1 family bicyclomycin/chloramphenicol resistance-like MFS transporter
MAALFAYVSGSSFVLQEQYGLSEQAFGISFGLGSVGLIGGTQLSARLLRRWEPQQILLGALVAGTAASVVLLAMAVADLGGLVGILVPLWVVLACAGLAMPNAPALALSRHGEVAGSAAALLGAVRFGIGAIAAPFVGVLGNDSIAMAVVVLASTALATTVLLVLVRPGRLDEHGGVAPADSIEMAVVD